MYPKVTPKLKKIIDFKTLLLIFKNSLNEISHKKRVIKIKYSIFFRLRIKKKKTIKKILTLSKEFPY